MSGYLTVLTGDHHCGSYFGLCPSKVNLEDQGEYRPSPIQRALLKSWLDFWGEVGQIARLNKVEAINLIFGGDLVDLNWHDSGAVFTRNPGVLKAVGAEIVDLALNRLRETGPKIPTYLFIVRGTPAHVGRK